MRRMLLLSDVVGLSMSFVGAQLLYAGPPAAGGRFGLTGEFVLFVCSLPIWVVLAKLYGLYDRDEERADHSTADDVGRVFHLVTVSTWLLFAFAYLSDVAHPDVPKLLVFWGLAVVTIPMIRAGARLTCRRSILYLQNTLIVGDGHDAFAIARKILKHPDYGLNLVGFAGTDGVDTPADLRHMARIVGADDVGTLVELLDIERVVLVPGHDEDVASALVRELNELDVQVDILPRLHEVISPAVDIHAVEGVPLLALRPPRLSRSSALLKRCFDVLGAGVGLIVLAPLFGAIALAIRLDSRGPVFFRQTRMGMRNRAFQIAKFRTMYADAEQQKADVAHLNKHSRDGGVMFKIDDDPRVTRVGRALRKLSVDELPQLWNVLRGEMSLVGPRPLILDEHAHVTDWGRRRLDIPPGITGLWQVLGRDDIPFAEMIKLDYLYITGWSLGGDMRLLLKTLGIVARGRGR